MVFSSRTGRERRNPLEVPSAPSSDVQPFAACSQRSQFALQPAASLSAFQGCQMNSVIVLHPVEAEIIKSFFFFFFSVLLLRSIVQLSAVSICHTDCGFEGVCTRAAIHPAKMEGYGAFMAMSFLGNNGQWAVLAWSCHYFHSSFLFSLTRGSCVDLENTQLRSAHQWHSISQIKGAK